MGFSLTGSLIFKVNVWPTPCAKEDSLLSSSRRKAPLFVYVPIDVMYIFMISCWNELPLYPSRSQSCHSPQDTLPKVFGGLKSGQSLLSVQQNCHLTVPLPYSCSSAPAWEATYQLNSCGQNPPTPRSLFCCPTPGKLVKETLDSPLLKAFWVLPPVKFWDRDTVFYGLLCT